MSVDGVKVNLRKKKKVSDFFFFSFFFYLNFERKDLRLGCMRCVLVSLQIKRLGSWSRRNQTNLLSSCFIWSGWIPSVVKLVRPIPTMNIMFLTSKFSETRFKFFCSARKSFPASLLQLARLVEGLFKLHSEASLVTPLGNQKWTNSHLRISLLMPGDCMLPRKDKPEHFCSIEPMSILI